MQDGSILFATSLCDKFERGLDIILVPHRSAINYQSLGRFPCESFAELDEVQ